MNSQLYTFLLMMAAGAALGFLFDCYRVTRSTLKLRWLLTALGDFCYWLIATAVVFLALLEGNWGEIRFYIFLALLSGAGMYFRFLSIYAVSLLGKAARTFGRLIRLIGAIVGYVVIKPVFLPLRWLFRLCLGGGRRAAKWLSSQKNGKPPEE